MAEAPPPPSTPAPAAGKVVMRSRDGRLYEVAAGDVATQQQNQGWAVAGDAEVQERVAEREQYAQYGSTGQQALGQAERFARTATLGAFPGVGDPADIEGRQQLTREESPVTSFLAQAAGTAVPALVAGAATGGLGAAAGLGSRVVQAGSMVAEGLAGGTADEVEEAQAQRRNLKPGYVLMYGLGGEIFGRVVPAVLRKGARVAREALGETGEGVLAGAERRALESAADVADGVPLGPDRDTFLVGAEKQILDTGAHRAAKSLDAINADMAEVTGEGALRPKVRKLVPETNAEQRQWAAETSQGALDLRNELKPKPGRKAPAGEPLPDGAPLPEGALPDAPAVGPKPLDYSQIAGLKKPAADLDRILTESSQRLDESSHGADWFEASGELERSLQRQEKLIEKAARTVDPLDQAAAQELLSKVQGYRRQLRLDRERVDLWGDAGDLQKGLNTALEDHWRPGSDVTAQKLGTPAGEGVLYDPGKLRGHLGADDMGRGVTPEFLEKQLAGAEQAIATHRRFGTASEAQLSRLEKNVQSVREQLRIADDVRGAKGRTAERAGVAKESARYEKESAGALREQIAGDAKRAALDAAKEEAIGAVAGLAVGAIADNFGLGAAVALGSKALRMGRLLDTLGRTGSATVGSAARGAVRGNAQRVLRAAEAGLGKASAAAVPLAMTAISRFQGDYPSVQSAFDAKRRTLQQIAQNPLALHRAVAQSFGPVAEANPQLHGEISARLLAVANYLHENMPTQLSASMTNPNGIPLSRATARDFALKYNSATNPASVLEDVRDGTASPTQIKALAAVHPDVYDQLRIEIARQVAEQPQMTTQRKLRLDILFGGDGLAGRAFAWPLAKAIKANRAQAATGAQAGNVGGASLSKNAPAARGTSAIASSVSNA